MTRILLVTNDFPPRRGGIQSYLEQFATRLAAVGEHQLVVYAPRWKGAEDYDRAAPFPVVRHPGTLMLPEPGVDRRMRGLIREHDIETVWFGAAAPLALLGSCPRSCRAACASSRRGWRSPRRPPPAWALLSSISSACRR
jgi:phosphatidylinositol alpha-1,6-mannosyltransferase